MVVFEKIESDPEGKKRASYRQITSKAKSILSTICLVLHDVGREGGGRQLSASFTLYGVNNSIIDHSL